ncbi:hypothetical protein EDD21DRAFT_392100, partial [Dissophora ornata]
MSTIALVIAVFEPTLPFVVASAPVWVRPILAAITATIATIATMATIATAMVIRIVIAVTSVSASSAVFNIGLIHLSLRVSWLSCKGGGRKDQQSKNRGGNLHGARLEKV